MNKVVRHPTRVARLEAIIEMASKKYEREGTLEIDDNTVVSEGDDNGAYVQAWVWVDFTGTPLDKKKKL